MYVGEGFDKKEIELVVRALSRFCVNQSEKSTRITQTTQFALKTEFLNQEREQSALNMRAESRRIILFNSYQKPHLARKARDISRARAVLPQPGGP